MTNNKIHSYGERIERLLDEIETLKGDIKDIYEEVKSAELKPKALRRAIADKRKKVDAEFEARVEEYAAALLAMPGATYRSVAEQTGIPKSTLQRRVPSETRGTRDKEPDAPMTVPELAAATIALAKTAPKQAAAVVAVLDALTEEPDLTPPTFLDRRRA